MIQEKRPVCRSLSAPARASGFPLGFLGFVVLLRQRSLRHGVRALNADSGPVRLLNPH